MQSSTLTLTSIPVISRIDGDYAGLRRMAALTWSFGEASLLATAGPATARGRPDRRLGGGEFFETRGIDREQSQKVTRGRVRRLRARLVLLRGSWPSAEK